MYDVPSTFTEDRLLFNTNNQRFLPAGVEIPDESAKLPQRKKNKPQKTDPNAIVPETIEIVSDHMDYFRDEDKVVATGNAVVTSADKQSKMKADKITFYRDTNELVAEGNVRALKSNAIVYGSFMRVDLNKNVGFMTSPKTGNSLVKIVAREGYVYSKDMEFIKGHAKFAQGLNYIVGTAPIYTGFEKMDNERMLKLCQSPRYKATHESISYRVKAKEIVIKSGEDRNIIEMKKAKIYKNKKKIGSVSKFVSSSETKMAEMDTNLPDFGYQRQMGAYLGPSYIFDGPGNSTLKLSPLLMYDGAGETGEGGNGGAGVGLMGRLRTFNNTTQVGYGSPRQKLVIKGKQEFDDERFSINYSANSFIDDWFMGGKMPYKYIDLAFNDETQLTDLGLIYKYRYSGAIASDYKVGTAGDWRMNSDQAKSKLPDNNLGWSTLKFKAQGEFSPTKPLYEIKDKLYVSASGQYDINQYGTGQTYSILRVGPTFVATPNDRLRLRGGYYMSGIQGESPFSWDQYYLGKQSVNVGYEYQCTKRLALGASHTYNLLKDNYDGRMLAENRIFVKYGPEDFKFCFSYDTLWRRTAMSVNMLVGSENSDVEFDKLKVKEFKKLQKQDEKAKAKELKNKKRKENEEKV